MHWRFAKMFAGLKGRDYYERLRHLKKGGIDTI